MIPDLTDRQREVFEFIREGASAGRTPTIREIGTRFGISSPNGVMCHIHSLVKKGLIRRDPLKARGIILTHVDNRIEKRSKLIAAAIGLCDGDCTLETLKEAVAEYRS